jgi:type VI secretion system secreted protein Hcp
MAPSSGVVPAAQADLFLKVTAKRGGWIKGEVKDDTHNEEISLSHWSWGMKQTTEASGRQQNTGRRQHRPLRVIKNIDKASCALMSCLAANDVLTEVLLTARNSGGALGRIEFLKIKLKNGRLLQIDVDYPDPVTGTGREILDIAFEEIEVEYTGEDEKKKQGSTAFHDQWMGGQQ